MAWEGITFAKQHPSPETDGMLRRACLPDSILSGGSLLVIGSTLSMDAGTVIVCGRLLKMDGVWQLTGDQQIARLVLTVDVSNPQQYGLSADLVYPDGNGSFADLRTDDINNGGSIYQVVLCVLHRRENNIWGIADAIPRAKFA